MILKPGDTHALVLHLWREPGPGANSSWRLSVEFVAHGPRQSFTDPADVAAILRPILDRVADAPVVLEMWPEA